MQYKHSTTQNRSKHEFRDGLFNAGHNHDAEIKHELTVYDGLGLYHKRTHIIINNVNR